ncbi:MAG: DsbA family protein, partial [Anaerolineae bacterium]|nr:DsbA family protein [Anaerolineae bacterium]
QQYLIIGAVAVIAVVVVVFLILANQPAAAEIPEEAVTLYEGIPQSVDENGDPVLGETDAPVEVVEYSSFDCPHCAEFHDAVMPALVDRVRAGEIKFTFVPVYGTGGYANGLGAGRAAICAGEQDAFWPYHSILFSWQSLYGNTAFAGNRLESGVVNLGLDKGAWDSCFASDRPDDVVLSAQQAAEMLPGFGGTPTVVVNGEIVTQTLDAINAAIDAALASAPPVDTSLDATEEAPAEATVEATMEATAEVTEAATEEATAEVTVEASE